MRTQKNEFNQKNRNFQNSSSFYVPLAHERLLIVACRPLDGALTPLQLLGVVVEAVGLPVERLAVRFKVEQAALAAVLVGALPLV